MRVDVSAQKLVIPDVCACCCNPASAYIDVSASKKRGKMTHTRTWEFPYCDQCIQHKGKMEGAALIAAIGIAVSALSAFALSWWAIIILAAAILASIHFSNSAKEAKNENCASSVCSITYRGWHGSFHSFRFDSVEYAHKFMLSNPSKLVNLSKSQRDFMRTNARF